MAKTVADGWRLGVPGAELRLVTRSVKASDQWVRLLGGGLAILLGAVVGLQGGSHSGRAPWLSVAFVVAGIVAVLRGIPREGALVLSEQSLQVPDWLALRSAVRTLRLADLSRISEQPVPYSDALSELSWMTHVSGKPKAEVFLVARDGAAEFAHRLRLRAGASAVDVPRPALLAERYHDPSSRPIAVAWLDQDWQAFRTLSEFADRAAAHPYRDREPLRVFASEHDFELLVRAHPGRPMQQIGDNKLLLSLARQR